MFKWLKKKGMEAVQKQCKFNIKLNTKTLVSVANRADAHIRESGEAVNQEQVYNAQEALLKDIILGCSNGLILDEIQSTVIQPVLDELYVTDGALLAIQHVINSAAEALGAETTKNQAMFNESMTTTFLRGNVKIESFDYDTTKFRIIENDALILVRNDTHLRLVEDITKIPSMAYFEVIAPMTAVEVIEGEIPQNYLHEYPLSHYLALRKRYIGE